MENQFRLNFREVLKKQFFSFKYYYIFAFICLYFTHRIQSELPFMAKKMADVISKNATQYDVFPFFYMAIGIVIFRTTSRILFFYPARIMQRNLRNKLLEVLECSSPLRYRKYSSGDLFQFLTGDIDQIRALIGFVGLQGGNFIIGLIVLIPKMIQFHPMLLWALSPMLISFFIFTFVVTKNKQYFRLTQEYQGKVQNLIIETYQGKKTIKNFHAENAFTKLFDEISLKELFYFYKSSLGISLTFPLIPFGIGLSMLWGAYIIKIQNLGASSLILFSGFIFLFMEPMGYLSWIGVVISRSHTSWKRLFDFNKVLETRTESENKIIIDNKENLKLHFRLDYWDKEIELNIHECKWNVLISKTGHGKTFLLEKMANALLAQNEKMSFVFQDPYLYNDSILKNIFLGQEINTEKLELAKKYLKLMGLDYLEKDLHKLLDLEVGENGKKLSGGQIKRLVLIRSLLSDAEVILWDDPFSSVDLILEKEIINLLKKEEALKKKTFILTAHRLSTVKHCDMAYLLEKDVGPLEVGEINYLLSNKTKTYEYFQNQMV